MAVAHSESETMSKEMTEQKLEARRAFLAKAGKFAIATPPTVAILLSATKNNYVNAASGVVCGNNH
jgi:hypothetical protein